MDETGSEINDINACLAHGLGFRAPNDDWCHYSSNDYRIISEHPGTRPQTVEYSVRRELTTHAMRCAQRNCYYRRKWYHLSKFKSWTRMLTLLFLSNDLGTLWIHLFSSTSSHLGNQLKRRKNSKNSNQLCVKKRGRTMTCLHWRQHWCINITTWRLHTKAWRETERSNQTHN